MPPTNEKRAHVVDWMFAHGGLIRKRDAAGNPNLSGHIRAHEPGFFNVTNTSGNGVSPITVTVDRAHGLPSGAYAFIQGVLGNTNANTSPTGESQISLLPSLFVSGASNANPCVITTTVAHGFTNGDIVKIDGVVGNHAANGTWAISGASGNTFTIPIDTTLYPQYSSGGIVTPADKFTVPGTGNGAYGGQGKVYVAKTLWKKRNKSVKWDGFLPDSGGANRIDLDSNGLLPIDTNQGEGVFGDGLYRFDVFDSTSSPTPAPLYSIEDAEYGAEFIINVKEFGAIGDGIHDDASAIQEAIDYALSYQAAHPRSTPIIWFPAGFYRTRKTIVVGKLAGAGPTWAAISIELRGEHRQLWTNGDKGAAIRADSITEPAIAIQGAQGVSIRNLAIFGQNDTRSNLQNDADLLVDSNFLKDLGGGVKCRNNTRSPCAGITIDGYCDASLILAADRYPVADAEGRYKASDAQSGTVTIEGCAIFGFTVGIAITPTAATQNVESVAIRDCNFACNRVALAIGQDQARNVTVENCTGVYQQFFLTNRIYGYGGLKFPNAVPPRLHNICIGRTKYVFDVNTPTAVLNVSSMYVETSLSLGYVGAEGTNTDNLCACFTGCEVQILTLPGKQVDFLLWNVQPVEFNSCAFFSSDNLFAANYTIVQPMVFYNQAALLFTNCVLDQLSMGPTSSSDPNVDKLTKGSFSIAFENPGMVRFVDSWFRDTSFTAARAMMTMDYDATDPTKLRRQPLPSPEYVIEGTRLRCLGTKLKSVRVATNVTLAAGADGEATFTASAGGLVNVGDVVYLSTTSYAPQWFDSSGSAGTSGSAHFVGVVKSVSGSTVTVKYVPQRLWSLLSLTVSLDVRYFARYRDLSYGTLTNGSSTVSSVTPDPALGTWIANDRVEHAATSPAIVPGAYVTAASTNQLTLSLSATASATSAPLVSADTVAHQVGGSALGITPALFTARYPGARKLLWEAKGLLSSEAPTRFYATPGGLEVTVNARWDGTNWNLDASSQPAGMMMVAQNNLFYSSMNQNSFPWSSWNDGLVLGSVPGSSNIFPYAVNSPLTVNTQGTGPLKLDTLGGGNIEIGGSAAARAITVAGGLAQQTVTVGTTSAFGGGSTLSFNIKDNASTDLSGNFSVNTVGLAKIRFNNGTSVPSNTTGNGYLLLPNTASRPTSASSGGGALSAGSGALYWMGTSGTEHQVASAGPHCGVCGYDFWRVAVVHRKWNAWHLECAHCNTVYKGGPENVHDLLTPEQKTEYVQPSMGWDEFLAVWEDRNPEKAQYLNDHPPPPKATL